MKLELLKYQNLLLEDLVESKRYIYDEISDNAKMLGIVGLRGVGKTTLLLQKLKENPENSIYFSMDNPKVSTVGLFDTVEKLYFDYGYRNFYIDEIHKYYNWNQELKNIYDSFPKIKVLFSGSSSVDIIKGSYDLSRRALIYKLNILSFSEYLNIKYKKNFSKISLENLFLNEDNRQELYLELLNIPLLQEFKNYLEFGEFPFFIEGNKKDYFLKIENIINKIIYEDIASFYKLKTDNLVNLKEILFFIINSEPGLFSANSLSKSLKISNDSVNNYVNILKEIGLINIINSYGNISQTIRKAKKNYLSISNINSNFSLQENNNIGRIREGFVVSNFINAGKEITYSKKGDFIFSLKDKKIEIEVGGKNKTYKQLKGVENGFLIKDDISIGESKNEIPLWMLGFLY